MKICWSSTHEIWQFWDEAEYFVCSQQQNDISSYVYEHTC
jgi:hypothetical protein